MDKLDIKLWSLAAKGEIVPDRSLLKTPEQIREIRRSADLNTAVLDHVAAHIKAGMSTAEIDRLVYDYTVSHGGIPAPLNYEGFPKSVCTSINNVVCHGIPDENEILREGDIINVDVSTILNPMPPACSPSGRSLPGQRSLSGSQESAWSWDLPPLSPGVT